MSRFSYYKIDKIMSMNAVYNFIVGGRGIGKTYGFKKYALDAYFKRGDQFIYLRRYKSEMKGRGEFFADIAHLYPKYDFRVFGKAAQCAPVETREDNKRKWDTMGFFIALSVAQNEKSVPYPHVKTILFDEFIIEKGMIKYLPDEAHVFNNFYSTVDRNLDKTRVFFMANSVSVMNPYFLEYKIRPDQIGELQKSHGGFVATHFPDSAAFKNEIYQTRFGQFVKDTEFADFAIESGFADGHLHMVNMKPSEAKYQYTLELPQGTVSVWYYGTGYYHTQMKRPGNEIFFTFNEENMDEGKILLQKNDRLVGRLRTAFSHARMSFDAPETRNIFIDIFKR